MNPTPLYQLLASKVNAYGNCLARGNREWELRHESDANFLVDAFMPSGSGIDSGTKLDWEATLRNPSRLVFTTSFHHMNDGGYYDGWTEHKITVKPSLMFGFELSITGRDRNQIKEYLHEVFDSALRQEIARDEATYYSPEPREAAKRFQESTQS